MIPLRCTMRDTCLHCTFTNEKKRGDNNDQTGGIFKKQRQKIYAHLSWNISVLMMKKKKKWSPSLFSIFFFLLLFYFSLFVYKHITCCRRFFLLLFTISVSNGNKTGGDNSTLNGDNFVQQKDNWIVFHQFF